MKPTEYLARLGQAAAPADRLQLLIEAARDEDVKFADYMDIREEYRRLQYPKPWEKPSRRCDE